MWKFTFLFLLLPFYSTGQSYTSSVIGKDDIENTNVTAAFGTGWHNLLRPTLRNPVSAFYRFSHENGHYKIELKLSAGGIHFVVAKNAVLEFEMEPNKLVTLYNEQYESSCRGCGSRVADASKEGVTLSFLLDKEAVSSFAKYYPYHMRLHLSDFELGGTISLKRSESFFHEFAMFRYHIEHRH